MRKIILSAVATITMSSFAVAGGDIVPVAPIAEPMEGNFYAGIAGSSLDARQTDNPINTIINENFTAVMLQAGYKFNEYFAVEGRAWLALDESVVNSYQITEDASMDVWAIYAKPMYPVTDSVDVYGLLGYASTNYDVPSMPINDVDSFSWGLGLQYAYTENISVFFDYVELNSEGKSPTDDLVDAFNLGVNYTF